MATKIKLTRVGRKNAPKYRIVIMEEHSKRDGAYIDELGTYDPIPNPHLLDVDDDKLKMWIERGAQFTDGTFKLLKNRLKTKVAAPKSK